MRKIVFILLALLITAVPAYAQNSASAGPNLTGERQAQHAECVRNTVPYLQAACTAVFSVVGCDLGSATRQHIYGNCSSRELADRLYGLIRPLRNSQYDTYGANCTEYPNRTVCDVRIEQKLTS